jgi:drug/metabolite transporter (DMT)-like permease
MNCVFSPVQQLDQKAPSRNTDYLLSITVLFCLLTVAGAILFPWEQNSRCDHRFPTYMVFQAGFLLLSSALSLLEASSLKQYHWCMIIYLVVCGFLSFFGLMAWSMLHSNSDCGPQLWTLGWIVLFASIVPSFCYCWSYCVPALLYRCSAYA